MYAQDYDETYPFAWGRAGAWYETCDPYIKGGVKPGASYDASLKGLWHCPSDYVTAGVSYDLSPELKIDVSYRYTDLGSAISGGSVPMI